jgi:ParB-like chromosome segregation protein Spo0J
MKRDDLYPLEKAKASFLPVDSLIPYARNARTHSDAQIAQLAASMVEFGFTNPVIADERSIIAGHGRVLAARKLYAAGKRIKLPGGDELPEGTVPVIDCTGWTEAQRKAYVIADNKLAMNADWDWEMLAVEVDELRDLDFSLPILGFTSEELNELIGTPNTGPEVGLTDEDAVPAIAVDSISERGDVWLLGAHRLMCGDSTKPDEVKRLLAGKKAALLQTDPPYGIAYVANAKSKGQSIAHEDIENDDLDGEKLQAFLEDVIRAALPHLAKGAAFYLWHPMLTQGMSCASTAGFAATARRSMASATRRRCGRSAERPARSTRPLSRLICGSRRSKTTPRPVR